MTKLMVFDDIDYRERVIKIPVQRDDELIDKMKAKVPALRQWLQDFHEKHMNLYPKDQYICAENIIEVEVSSETHFKKPLEGDSV